MQPSRYLDTHLSAVPGMHHPCASAAAPCVQHLHLHAAAVQHVNHPGACAQQAAALAGDLQQEWRTGAKMATPELDARERCTF